MNRVTLIFATLGLVWWGLRMRDLNNLARTIWGEARNQGRDGMQAVANVVMNRVQAGKWFSGTVSQVVLAPFQFSVWNESDPNRKLVTAVNDTDPQFLEALEIASLAMQGRLPDITGGATHYHATYVSPDWAQTGQLTTQIGDHIFYKGVA